MLTIVKNFLRLFCGSNKMEIEHKIKTRAKDRKSVTVHATPTKLIDWDDSRYFSVIVNDSANTIYIDLGANPVLGQGLRINANGGWLSIGKDTDFPYGGEVWGIASGDSNATVTTV